MSRLFGRYQMKRRTHITPIHVQSVALYTPPTSVSLIRFFIEKSPATWRLTLVDIDLYNERAFYFDGYNNDSPGRNSRNTEFFTTSMHLMISSGFVDNNSNWLIHPFSLFPVHTLFHIGRYIRHQSQTGNRAHGSYISKYFH